MVGLWEEVNAGTIPFLNHPSFSPEPRVRWTKKEHLTGSYAQRRGWKVGSDSAQEPLNPLLSTETLGHFQHPLGFPCWLSIFWEMLLPQKWLLFPWKEAFHPASSVVHITHKYISSLSPQPRYREIWIEKTVVLKSHNKSKITALMHIKVRAGGFSCA